VLKVAEGVGLHDLPNVPSLALGTGLVTPLELTAAYAVFPNGGFAVKPRAIVRILDDGGATAYENPLELRRVLSEPVAFQALPIWTEFMRRTARALPAASFEPPAGLREVELCRVSYLRPVENCPTYVEYFKEGDDVPSRLCPIHRGSFKQEARRAVNDILSTIGRKLRGIFKW